VYLDARPNDRVRGFALGRMSYDPLLPPNASAALSSNNSTAGSSSVAPIFSGATNAPRVALDQLWLRFDIAHTLFITAGKQHVRWGTARFWMPADFLHLRRRNPLDVFDTRTGTTMVKVHLPVESRAWNFYAYGITENTSGKADLTAPAGALRGEFVLDAFELGLGVYKRVQERAKFAADISFGVGDIDFYSEVAVTDGRTVDRVGYDPTPLPAYEPKMLPDGLKDNATLTAILAPVLALDQQAQALRDVDTRYPVYRKPGYLPQVVAGFSHTHKYNDNDTFIVGGEYFYNGFGYADRNVYSGLILPHTRQLQNAAGYFYFGKHYAALFVSFPAPFKLDLHTFNLSTLCNLSDRSFTSRFDYSFILLTHLRFEAYAALAYGERGEFRFKLASMRYIDPAQLGVPNPTVLTVGVGLRLAI
jgi:hypothetical protein